MNIIFLLLTFFADGSEQKTEKPVSYYAAVFTVGPSWDTSKTAHHQMNFPDHVNNLKLLQESGKMALGARHGKYGLVVVKATDENEARSFFQLDSTVIKKIFSLEINKFNPFYKGCIE